MTLFKHQLSMADLLEVHHFTSPEGVVMKKNNEPFVRLLRMELPADVSSLLRDWSEDYLDHGDDYVALWAQVILNQG
jgi:hypothetical protein